MGVADDNRCEKLRRSTRATTSSSQKKVWKPRARNDSNDTDEGTENNDDFSDGEGLHQQAYQRTLRPRIMRVKPLIDESEEEEEEAEEEDETMLRDY